MPGMKEMMKSVQEAMSAGQAGSEPVTVRLSDVEPMPVEWLWKNRIAVGKVTGFAGDPSLGKSLVTLDIAARVTTGAAWPDLPGMAQAPGKVVLLTAEDDLADTIRPRLDAAGANAENVIALQAVRDSNAKNGRERPVSLETDLEAIGMALQRERGVRLVIIDPISAYLGKVDSHKNAEVRALLAPLGDLAAKHRVSIITVHHLNKGTGGKAKHRVSGSLAFVAAARACWLFGVDDKDSHCRLMIPLKNNLAEESNGLAYEIVPSEANPAVGVVKWKAGVISITADDMVADDETRSELDAAAEWLRSLLESGPVPAAEVYEQAKQNGFSSSTLRRAAKRIGVAHDKQGIGAGGRWTWRLKQHAKSPPSRKHGDVGQLKEEMNILEHDDISQSTEHDQGNQDDHVSLAGASEHLARDRSPSTGRAARQKPH